MQKTPCSVKNNAAITFAQTKIQKWNYSSTVNTIVKKELTCDSLLWYETASCVRRIEKWSSEKKSIWSGDTSPQ